MTVAECSWMTVKGFCQKYPAWPSESALRAIILEAGTNGFKNAFKRVGRRVLVNEKAFWGAVEGLQEASHACAR